MVRSAEERERLVRESLELPGFSTLNESAARIRMEVNAAMFARILARMTAPEVLRTNRLLEVVGAVRYRAATTCTGRSGSSGARSARSRCCG